MTYRYFAYGSNLDAGHFADWTREHGYEGFVLENGQPAVIDDYELALSVPSKYWAGAVGTIVPRPGGAVYGVLFELGPADVEKIRHKEGVASGLYREIEVEARIWIPGSDETATLQILDAAAFVAADGRTVDPPPAPSSRWLEAVIRGGRAAGLPESWLGELQHQVRV
jgi:gamma-glutamylcyclotransferase